MPFSSGFLLSLSLCLDIGIANIAMITLAMQRGFLQGFWLGLGTCVGDLLYAVAALAGMTVLLQFDRVRWALWLGGSALLVWFAIKMLLAAWRGGASASARSGSSGIGLARVPPGNLSGHVIAQRSPLVRGSRGYADLALRGRQPYAGRLVPGGILRRRAALVPVAMRHRKPGRSSAGGSSTDFGLSAVGGDLLLFRGIRDRFGLPRIHPGGACRVKRCVVPRRHCVNAAKSGDEMALVIKAQVQGHVVWV